MDDGSVTQPMQALHRSRANRTIRAITGSALVAALWLLVPATSAALETKTERYTPFDADGEVRSDLSVTDLSGECLTSS